MMRRSGWMTLASPIVQGDVNAPCYGSKMVRAGSAFPLLLLLGSAGGSAAQSLVLPSGTPLWIKTETAVPMRVGAPVRAQLVYGVYAEDELVLPAGTVIEGTVTGLQADHAHRINARLRADFTPFSKPVVQFTSAVVGGQRVPLALSEATEGAPVMQLTPPPPHKGGFLRSQYHQGMSMVKDRVRLITGPGKKDRLVQLLYSQLPYHPQRVQAGTVWTTDTMGPLKLAAAPGAVVPAPPLPPESAATKEKDQRPVENSAAATWTLQAYLKETSSSAHARVGDPIEAVVTQPVLDSNGTVAVPEGSVLTGEITRARAARRFGRAGELRFDFKKINIPGEDRPQDVQANLAGIDAIGDSNLALDREGQLQPKPKDKVVVPLLLLTLAGRPLDHDGNHGGSFGKDAVASNSLGVIGFVAGTAGASPYFAAGLGYYGSALAIWNRWIKRGDNTTLRRDTRMVIQTTARRSPPLRSGSSLPPKY